MAVGRCASGRRGRGGGQPVQVVVAEALRGVANQVVADGFHVAHFVVSIARLSKLPAVMLLRRKLLLPVPAVPVAL